jgi:hypothetical protein
VGRYLSQHFVAAHQQVGEFQVIDQSGQLVKTGGNVATYFTTPDGRVVHAVLGPVSADELLEESRWAVGLYRRAQAEGGDLAAPVVLAHRETLQRDPSAGGRCATPRRVHEFLAAHPLPRLEDVYREVFTRSLGQALSRDAADVRESVAAVERARRSQLPILFILHRERDDRTVLDRWNALVNRSRDDAASSLADLAAHYAVIVLPISELPQLSRSLNVRPFAAHDRDVPVFVVTRSDARQLAAVTGWTEAGGAPLEAAMAEGLVQSAKEYPRSRSQLTRLQRLVGPIDRALAAQVATLAREGG